MRTFTRKQYYDGLEYYMPDCSPIEGNYSYKLYSTDTSKSYIQIENIPEGTTVKYNLNKLILDTYINYPLTKTVYLKGGSTNIYAYWNGSLWANSTTDKSEFIIENSENPLGYYIKETSTLLYLTYSSYNSANNLTLSSTPSEFFIYPYNNYIEILPYYWYSKLTPRSMTNNWWMYFLGIQSENFLLITADVYLNSSYRYFILESTNNDSNTIANIRKEVILDNNTWTNNYNGLVSLTINLSKNYTSIDKLSLDEKIGYISCTGQAEGFLNNYSLFNMSPAIKYIDVTENFGGKLISTGMTIDDLQKVEDVDLESENPTLMQLIGNIAIILNLARCLNPIIDSPKVKGFIMTYDNNTSQYTLPLDSGNYVYTYSENILENVSETNKDLINSLNNLNNSEGYPLITTLYKAANNLSINLIELPEVKFDGRSIMNNYPLTNGNKTIINIVSYEWLSKVLEAGLLTLLLSALGLPTNSFNGELATLTINNNIITNTTLLDTNNIMYQNDNNKPIIQLDTTTGYNKTIWNNHIHLPFIATILAQDSLSSGINLVGGIIGQGGCFISDDIARALNNINLLYLINNFTSNNIFLFYLTDGLELMLDSLFNCTLDLWVDLVKGIEFKGLGVSLDDNNIPIFSGKGLSYYCNNLFRPDFINTTYTIEIIFKPVIDSGKYNINSRKWLFCTNKTGNLGFAIYDGRYVYGSIGQSQSRFVFSLYNSNELNIISYNTTLCMRNRELISKSGNDYISYNIGNGTYIGSGGNNDSSFAGKIYMIRVYSKLLTLEEMLYNLNIDLLRFLNM